MAAVLLATSATAFQPALVPRKSLPALSRGSRATAPPVAVAEAPVQLATTLTLLASEHHHEVASPLVLLTSASAVMLLIVGLLLAWEEGVHAVKHWLPKALLPVVESMLAEVAGLGFIGLLLSVVVTGGEESWVAQLSERFLGEGELLLELFEFLHTSFFEVGIAFFAASALILVSTLSEVDKMAEACAVESLEELATLEPPKPTTDGVWLAELQKSTYERGYETCLLQERFTQKQGLPPSYPTDAYFGKWSAEVLEEFVELSPTTWLPLIPLIALGNAVDLSHDVISGASANAADAAGAFLATPWFNYPALATNAVIAAWAFANFDKMARVKAMLMPSLSADGTLLPPKLEDADACEAFESAPPATRLIELVGEATPARNAHERLFGKLGAAGPDFYLNSIKLNNWVCVAFLILVLSQVVGVDVGVLLDPDKVAGVPEALVPELALYGSFCALYVGILAVSPKTFMTYALVTAIEELAKEELIDRDADGGSAGGEASEEKKEVAAAA